LDEPSAVRLDAAIFVVERPDWAPLPEGVPHFEEYYNPGELLPTERFARMKALLPK
jgi:hypothetical protein